MGRNQMVLDYSRAAVVDHMFDTLSKLLLSCNIEYVEFISIYCMYVLHFSSLPLLIYTQTIIL